MGINLISLHSISINGRGFHLNLYQPRYFFGLMPLPLATKDLYVNKSIIRNVGDEPTGVDVEKKGENYEKGKSVYSKENRNGVDAL